MSQNTATHIEDAPDWEMSFEDWIAILGSSLGAFMAILDTQITNASLGEIQGSLGLDMSEGGWISTSYLIAEVVVIPLTAFFSKVFGMRTYVLVNCAAFILSSILCGCAWNLSSMVVFRIFQGLSGGTLIPMAFQAMLLFMPPQKKTIGLAIFGMTATLAPTLGPSLGGWLTENYSWRANFLINIVPGALMIFAIRFGMPKARMNLGKLRKMDVWGTICLVSGLGSLTYILEEGAKLEWFSDFHIRMCALAVISTMPLFVALQLNRKEPLLNLRLLAERNFGLSAVVTMLTAIALYGGIYALSLYLGQIQNYGALQIGQVMIWIGIPQIFIMPLVPFLMKKVDSRILAIAGMLLFAMSNYMNAHLNSDYSGDQFRISLMIRAIGQPLFMIPLSAMAMALISPMEVANASSIYNVMRNLGGSIGIALTGTSLLSRQNHHFSEMIGTVSPYDTFTAEKLSGLQKLLFLSGTEYQGAKDEAVKTVVKLVHRDALIGAFSDVFAMMAVGLVVCILLIVLLRKTVLDTSRSSEAVH